MSALCVVLVGDRGDSATYVRMKQQAATEWYLHQRWLLLCSKENYEFIVALNVVSSVSTPL